MALNHSRQRDAIMDFLSHRKDHPTAEVIYDNVKKVYPKISLGTVYRNLTLLADNGVVRRLRTRDSKDHFDADLSPHYHFMCNGCGCITDIFMNHTKELETAAGELTPGMITGHEVFFYGTCPSCMKIKNET